MQDKEWQGNRLTGVVILLGVLIAYGSFYPFDFVWHSLSLDELRAFFVGVDRRTTLGDILGNVLLFLPYGFVAVFAAEHHPRPRTYLGWLVGAGLALAVLIQIVQIFLKSRIPAIGDAFWNALGLALGLAGGWLGQSLLHRHRLFRTYSRLRFSLPVLLVGLFVVSQWFPFVPALDWQMIKDNAKPLLKQPVWDSQVFAQSLAAWLAALYFYARTWPRAPLVLRPWGLVLGILGVSLFTKANPLHLGEAAGAALAALVLPFVIQGRRRLWVLAVLFLGQGYAALTPFELAEPLNAMRWIPFTGFLKGSIWANTQELLDKAFLYGAMLMLLAEAGVGWRPNALIVGLWVGLVEFGQILVAGRHPELTEPILVVLMAFGLAQAQHSFQHGAAAPPPMPEGRIAPDSGRRRIERGALRLSPEGLRGGLLWAGGLSVVATLVLNALVAHPSAPYNLRELFLGGWFSQWLFVLAAGWLGFGAGLAALRLREGPAPVLRLPLYALACGLVLYVLLRMSVTVESLDDIAGAPNLHWHLLNQAWWGGFGQSLAGLMSAESLAALERPVRFLALILPLLLGLLAMAGLRRRNGGQVLAVAAALPWLWLAKWLAFDHSSTDNLNELIAMDAALGLGGGVYLYLLVLLITGMAAWLAERQARDLGQILVAVLAVALSLPLGWVLFENALVSDFVKYGDQAYSGVDFFLGPDRKTKLEPGVLFARWCALQAVLQLGLAFSLRLGLGIARPVRDALR